MAYDGAFQRKILPGDILCGFEPALQATDTTVTLAYTAALIFGSNAYVRNPAGVSTDTYPTADALITALMTGLGLSAGAPTGMTFRWRIINLSANALTGAVTANTGVTMTRGDVAASTSKDFLITILNGTPAKSVVNITSVNASAVLSGFSATDLAALSFGMVVTNAVVNQQGNTIIGINTAAGTVTMSGNSNAAGPSTFNFSPRYSIVGLAA
jgi:hypothetical protein